MWLFVAVLLPPIYFAARLRLGAFLVCCVASIVTFGFAYPIFSVWAVVDLMNANAERRTARVVAAMERGRGDGK